MKVFISIPMTGRTEKNIIEEMNIIRKEFEKLDIEVLDSYCTDNVEDNRVVNDGVYYLGKSLEIMSMCNAVYFARGYSESRGCVIERRVANEYGMVIFEPNFIKYTYIRDNESPNIGTKHSFFDPLRNFEQTSLDL